jgi:hypothetical protein
MKDMNGTKLLLKWSTRDPYASDPSIDSFSYKRSCRVASEFHARCIVSKLLLKSKFTGFYFDFELWREKEKGIDEYELWKEVDEQLNRKI